MKKYINICAIVPDNFKHKAGDGLSTRKHHLKWIHPALQACPGSTQATYVLEILESEKDKWKLKINP